MPSGPGRTAGASPRARGKRLQYQRLEAPRGSIPALVQPRVCGVVPYDQMAHAVHLRASLAVPIRARQAHVEPRFAPASAGNTRRPCGRSFPPAVSPRARGEYPLMASIRAATAGSSPRARGSRNPVSQGRSSPWVHPRACGAALAAQVGRIDIRGFIPARAGNCRPARNPDIGQRPLRGTSPRLRGPGRSGPASSRRTCCVWRASQLTPLHHRSVSRPRVDALAPSIRAEFPAVAGSCRTAPLLGSIPAIAGSCRIAPLLGSIPAVAGSCRIAPLLGSIPAVAGSCRTAPLLGSIPATAGVAWSMVRREPTGSSPRARGSRSLIVFTLSPVRFVVSAGARLRRPGRVFIHGELVSPTDPAYGGVAAAAAAAGRRGWTSKCGRFRGRSGVDIAAVIGRRRRRPQRCPLPPPASTKTAEPASDTPGRRRRTALPTMVPPSAERRRTPR